MTSSGNNSDTPAFITGNKDYNGTTVQKCNKRLNINIEYGCTDKPDMAMAIYMYHNIVKKGDLNKHEFATHCCEYLMNNEQQQNQLITDITKEWKKVDIITKQYQQEKTMKCDQCQLTLPKSALNELTSIAGHYCQVPDCREPTTGDNITQYHHTHIICELCNQKWKKINESKDTKNIKAEIQGYVDRGMTNHATACRKCCKPRSIDNLIPINNQLYCNTYTNGMVQKAYNDKNNQEYQEEQDKTQEQ
ncbi:9339_t:CDS:2 [Ambispora gerdemannii]|uniref:9339_t:CDS:1 n=1 Tax=Ambispora gerdemannii TaxID=144530 RepID=A0A9N9C6U4_9GLOM|nr:9339_t:CDS:2 [Ambispora gerdemannii]